MKLAVFIDFDNIQIGVRDTLSKDFDVSLVLEALKERGEVVAKIAYADWARAGEHSRQMTQHAIQMVQRSVTPRGDKNGADINLALDALEMAFTRHHINAFAIVGGDSDFMALVEKLKQYDKQVFVIGGRAFTSNILQKNCTEFVAYENLLKSDGGGRGGRSSRRGEASSRAVSEARSLSEALPNIQRALKILADRGVAPQLGLLKSTLLQLDSTFSERDYGATSFLEFMQKVDRAGLAQLRQTERGFLVEPVEPSADSSVAAMSPGAESAAEGEAPAAAAGEESELSSVSQARALDLMRQAVEAGAERSPGRPLYIRQIRGRLRALDSNFDERQYGYRGTLDLLHAAQREGWLKLQRDHNGAWRIYASVPTSSRPVDSASEALVQPEVEPVTIVESVDTAPPSESEHEAGVPESPQLAPQEGALEALQPPFKQPEPAPPAETKTRKTRSAKSTSKTTRRRTATRRKAAGGPQE